MKKLIFLFLPLILFSNDNKILSKSQKIREIDIKLNDFYIQKELLGFYF